jgi:DNA polymerase I-like protein with 3'-5' exonuclease and polymerase domains
LECEVKVVETAKLRPGTLSHHDALQVYNGLDCALTVEIFNEVSGPNMANVTPAQRLIYDFERGMQGPALEMMLRGWKVDLFKRDLAVAKLKREKIKLQKLLDKFVIEVGFNGKSQLSGTRKSEFVPGLNTGSPKQMKEFLYGTLRLPEQFAWPKGVKTLTTNREALEELENYLIARPFINCIFAIKKRSKQISVLSSEVSDDGRMRTSYNVTGTETGRWSSSKSGFDEGTNLQNITEELRGIFIADAGKKLAYIDLSQAESRVLGFLIWSLFGDASYLDACESGDLHTLVAKPIWPDLKWTGDLKLDREVAEEKFYLHFSYRDLAKRGGHATNYYGKPRTVARHLKVRQHIIENFQAGYFSAFPGIPEYHRWVAQQLQTKQYLETPLGDGRHFFGRPGDDATLREAIAHVPQSMVGRLLNLALWRNWKFVPKGQLLGQVHDALITQYDEADEVEVLTKAKSLMLSPLFARNREFTIPSDIMVGWNWQKYDATSNPDGIRKWYGTDDRVRQFDPRSAGLDRRIS